MASASDRAKLARAAHALNEGAGASALPALILMTDRARLADPSAAARLLPAGSAVIVRHSNASVRAALARALAVIARQCGLRLLVSDDPHLAVQMGAHGLHLPEVRAREAAHWRALRPSWLITAAAHSLRGVIAARIAGADAVLLAPVFLTSSHPDRRPLGASRVRMIAAQSAIPVYALGGINAQTISRLKDARLAGIAAIEGLRAD